MKIFRQSSAVRLDEIDVSVKQETRLCKDHQERRFVFSSFSMLKV